MSVTRISGSRSIIGRGYEHKQADGNYRKLPYKNITISGVNLALTDQQTYDIATSIFALQTLTVDRINERANAELLGSESDSDDEGGDN